MFADAARYDDQRGTLCLQMLRGSVYFRLFVFPLYIRGKEQTNKNTRSASEWTRSA